MKTRKGVVRGQTPKERKMKAKTHANHYLETRFPSRKETANVLLEFAKVDPICAKAFEKLRGKETCFGWEEPLLNFIDIL